MSEDRLVITSFVISLLIILAIIAFVAWGPL